MTTSKRPFEAAELYALRTASGVRLSPDGKRAAMTVQFADREKDEYRSVVSLVDVESGALRECTDPAKRSWTASFSPDGETLAFLSDRSGANQIWTIRLDGGEPSQITFFKNGVDEPVWSPDGKRIAFLSSGGERETAEGAKKDDKPAVKIVKRVAYREDGRGYFHDKPNHVFVIAAAGGEPTQLTAGDDDDRRPQWSPDGTLVAFLANRTGDPSLDVLDVWVVASTGEGQPIKLTASRQVLGSFAWSPDGRELVVIGHDNPKTPGDRTVRVGFLPATGGDAKFVTDAEGPSYASLLIGPGHTDWYPAPRWTKRGVFAIAHTAGRQHVHLVSRAGAAEPVVPGDLAVWAFDATADGLTTGFIASTIDQPPNLFRLRADGMRKLTDINPWMAQLEQPEIDVFQYASGDARIDAWLLHPAGKSKEEKLPLLLVVHGGPHCAYGYGWRFQNGPFAQAGYRVLLVNPRGSSGYGEKFMRSIHPETGDVDQKDVLAAVDAAIQRGGVDTKRIGVTGGSYGGFMTNMLLGRTDRFGAGVTIATISNWFSFYGTSDYGWTMAWEFDAEPWADGKFYSSQSPMTYARKIKAPVLILHGEDDLRCPIEQSEQLFAVLQRRGIPSELRRYPGEPHGLGSRRPSFREDTIRATIAWFDKYLK